MIFFSNKSWRREVADIYDFSSGNISYFSGLSYMATGGISRRVPIPHFLYKILFGLDVIMAGAFPRVFSSFFIVRLTKRG